MDMRHRSASVVAVEPCSAIELSSASLFAIYEKDLEQFTLIQMNMGREVSRRLREADDRLFEARHGNAAVLSEYVFRST
jgi:CRP/FNR family cyclic AMP-dependent transcriptional regulator